MEFFYVVEVVVIVVVVDIDRDVEFDLVVGVVGLGFVDVKGDVGVVEYDVCEGEVDGFGGWDDVDVFEMVDLDVVVC